jgi:hypothetical protein
MDGWANVEDHVFDSTDAGQTWETNWIMEFRRIS